MIMIKRLLFFLLLSQAVYLLSAEEKVFIQVDSAIHRGPVNKVIVDRDRNFFLSCSEDKSIKMRSLPDFTLEKRFLGWISSHTGEIKSIALSPDNKYLLSCGYFEQGVGPRFNYLRLYDLKSGRLLKKLFLHNDFVNDITFSTDGHYLYSCCNEGTIAIWDLGQDFKVIKTYKGHSFNAVYKLLAYQEEGENYILSSGSDNRLLLYSQKKARLVRDFTSPVQLPFLASSDKRIAAGGYCREIYIFNKKLEMEMTLRLESEIAALDLSEDGRYLCTALYNDWGDYSCRVYDLEKKAIEVFRFNGHKIPVEQLKFINQQKILSVSASALFLWEFPKAKICNSLDNRVEEIYALALSENKIAYGAKWAGDYYEEEAIFDLNKQRIMPLQKEDLSSYSRLSREKGNLVLQSADSPDYQDGLLLLYSSGNLISKIERGAASGFCHAVYGFTEQGNIISGGFNGKLQLFNQSGKLLCSFKGHSGLITALACQGDTLISAAEDRTIKIWDLQAARRGKEISPKLSLCLTKDREWVLYTEKGQYYSSLQGDDFLAFHINQGKDREALLYQAEHFYSRYYNPSLIKSLLDTTASYQDRKSQDNYISADKIIPPRIEVSSRNITTKDSEITIAYKVHSSCEKIENVLFKVNGASIVDRGLDVRQKGNAFFIEGKKTLPLFEKENLISIEARTKSSRSETVFINVRRSKESKINKPDLYLYAVGAAQYEDRNLELEFADDDALAFEQSFTRPANPFYRKIHSRLLLNKEANSKNIKKTLSALHEKKPRPQDIVIVFLAGHGLNDEKGNYYFLPCDVNLDKLSETAIDWHFFIDFMEGLSCRVVFFIDSCHAGNILGDLALDNNQAFKKIKQSSCQPVLFTASMPGYTSREYPELKHGVFTYSILECFKGKNKYSEKQISIKALDLFISDEVSKMTRNTQLPCVLIPRAVPNFSIYEMRE